MQIVYHGEYCKIENPQIIESKYIKDFGKGFYCTILKEQAIKWATKYDDNIELKFVPIEISQELKEEFDKIKQDEIELEIY